MRYNEYMSNEAQKALILVVLSACGQAPGSQTIQVQPTRLAPSTASCQSLQALTDGSAPVQVSGYAEGHTMLVTALQVFDVDQLGHQTPTTTGDAPVGTYCTMNYENGKLTSVTMAEKPGCYSGWGNICDSSKEIQ